MAAPTESVGEPASQAANEKNSISFLFESMNKSPEGQGGTPAPAAPPPPPPASGSPTIPDSANADEWLDEYFEGGAAPPQAAPAAPAPAPAAPPAPVPAPAPIQQPEPAPAPPPVALYPDAALEQAPAPSPASPPLANPTHPPQPAPMYPDVAPEQAPAAAPFAPPDPPAPAAPFPSIAPVEPQAPVPPAPYGEAPPGNTYAQQSDAPQFATVATQQAPVASAPQPPASIQPTPQGTDPNRDSLPSAVLAATTVRAQPASEPSPEAGIYSNFAESTPQKSQQELEDERMARELQAQFTAEANPVRAPSGAPVPRPGLGYQLGAPPPPGSTPHALPPHTPYAQAPRPGTAIMTERQITFGNQPGIATMGTQRMQVVERVAESDEEMARRLQQQEQSSGHSQMQAALRQGSIQAPEGTDPSDPSLALALQMQDEELAQHLQAQESQAQQQQRAHTMQHPYHPGPQYQRGYGGYGAPPMPMPVIPMMHRSNWVPDKLIKECTSCGDKFKLFTRKHHCRFCGQVFCDGCTRFRITCERACQGCAVRIGNDPNYANILQSQQLHAPFQPPPATAGQPPPVVHPETAQAEPPSA